MGFHESFDEAKAEADKVGGLVSGTIRKDGAPVYWVSPKDASEESVRERAFEARNGRPLSAYERSLISVAERTAERQRIEAQ